MFYLFHCIALLAAMAIPWNAKTPMEETAVPGNRPNLKRGSEGMTPEQRRRADQIISVFENNTLEIQYDYVEELGDGRGVTAGRAGFTSATGDLVMVVERYVARKPDSPLKQYMIRLQALAEEEDGSTEGLEGLSED